MSHSPTTVVQEPKRLGLLAQFAGPDELIAAAEKVTDEGYTRVEAFAPFAVLGIDEALKAKGTILPWIALTLGIIGGTKGLLLQWYTNGTEWGNWLSGYQFMISGKPYFSLPANIPVTFELIILLAAFGAFFGMLFLNGLPKLSNPLFRSERFRTATTDGFFLYVETDDPKFAEAETSAYLTSVGASAVEPIDEVQEGRSVPARLLMIGAVAASLALLPPLWVWASSTGPTTIPRISWFKDMEAQAKSKPQQTSSLFADGRAMRVSVEGTVPRGGLKEDIALHYGVESLADLEVAEPAEGEEPADPPWITHFPVEVNAELMNRGEQRFNIYCATCHGLAGDGDGLITQRAMALEQGTWLMPTSLHAEAVTTQPVGKLYNTITNGVRKMPGYREQITTQDRWAIALYVQALQRSRAASADDLPEEKLNELNNRN